MILLIFKDNLTGILLREKKGKKTLLDNVTEVCYNWILSLKSQSIPLMDVAKKLFVMWLNIILLNKYKHISNNENNLTTIICWTVQII